MAENSSQPENLTETLSGSKKKNRRGQRANKKPHPASVEKLLASVCEPDVQPKKRQPRRPKIPGEEKEKINIENVSVLKVVEIEDSVIAQNLLENLTIDVDSKSEVKPASLDASKPKMKGKKSEGVKKTRARNQTENFNANSAREPRVQNGVWTRTRSAGTQNPRSELNGFDKNKFSEYIDERTARKLLSAQIGKEFQEYVEGNIRINPKFFKEAYIAMPNNEADLLINGVQDRNRALEGDLVVVRVNSKDKWRGWGSPRPQKTGTVVCILEKIHSRKIVGFLRTMPDNNRTVALFCPKDHRVPRLNIDAAYWPDGFSKDPEAFAKTMFFAEIVSWNDVRFARGKILARVGEAGDLKAEGTGILMENDLDVTPYGEELTRDLPPSEYQPSREDIEGREDWRKECVFTIDPATAQDLDDAMSCKPLENGNFEVGVHISDVTHYLAADSALDKAVSKRATTIYMSDSVYHMLPKQLCNVCSLLPGSDKLAFSIIFEITPSAEVVKHRFAKTVINSCCQFAYEHAQMMIKNPEKTWGEDEVPKIAGPYKISQLSTVVNNLNNLAVKMRENRLNNGSLRIDQPKLYVLVDRESGLPISFTLEEQKDSNRLIEEFMLLANATAATHLYKNLPDVALLRRHQEPLMRILTETQAMLEKLGVHIDIESAGALQASLLRYQPDPETSSEKDLYLASCRSKVLNALCSKTMARAKYFCTSANLADIYLRHYALNIPLYTHFTSPIRRYSDCIVHRLLYASITNALPVPNWTPEQCARIAANCNKQKYNAKRAQEMSSELYLTALLGIVGPVNATAIAIDVKDRSVDVIVCEMGITLRIYSAEIQEFASVEHDKSDDVQTLKVVWKKSNAIQVINIFSIMNIRVSKHPETNRLHGELLEPEKIGF